MFWYGYRLDGCSAPMGADLPVHVQPSQQQQHQQQQDQQVQARSLSIPVQSPPLISPQQNPSLRASNSTSPHSPFVGLTLPPSQQNPIQHIYTQFAPETSSGSRTSPSLPSTNIPHKMSTQQTSTTIGEGESPFINTRMSHSDLSSYIQSPLFPTAPQSSSGSKKRSFPDDLEPSLAGSASGPARPSSGAEGSGERETSEGAEEKGGNGRYLKQTKRAAQNRAAQQAFRKRKEERVRELEDKEKLLEGYIDRELELVRRERDLRERENRLVQGGQATTSESTAAAATTSTTIEASTSTPDLASLFKLDPSQIPSSGLSEDSSTGSTEILSILEQLVKRLVDSTGQEASKTAYTRLLRGIEATARELTEAKKKHGESRTLIDSLRLSLGEFEPFPRTEENRGCLRRR